MQDEKKSDGAKKIESKEEAKEPSSVLPAMQRLLVGKICPHKSTHTETHVITEYEHTHTYDNTQT